MAGDSGGVRRLTVVLASTCLLAFAGCTAGSSPTTPPAATASPSASATPQASSTPPGGTIQETVAPQKQSTAKPVNLDKTHRDGKVAVSLKSIVSKNVKGHGPGEISGPSLVVTVKVVNGSTSALNVDSAIVTLIDSKGNVGSPMTAGARPFTGSIRPGASATGVYVFRVAPGVRAPIHVSVTYSPKRITALFVGNVK